MTHSKKIGCCGPRGAIIMIIIIMAPRYFKIYSTDEIIIISNLLLPGINIRTHIVFKSWIW